MSMFISHRHFNPGWLPTLVTLALLALLVNLGLWQLERAEHKRAMLSAHDTRTALPSVAFGHLEASDPQNRYRHIYARGVYDNRQQILLDNQVNQGQPGYHVYTPFLPDGSDVAILVNRGWVPWGETRTRLPDISLESTTVTLNGRIDQPANPGIRLGDALAQPDWPKVMPYIDYGPLSERLGYPLKSAVILLDPDQPQGFRREWQLDFAGFGPERHVGYAVQWFALSATLLVLYGLFGWQRRSVNGDDTL